MASPDPLDDFRVYLAMLWDHLRLPSPTDGQYLLAARLQHGPRRDQLLAFRGVGKSWIAGGFVTWRLKRHYSGCEVQPLDFNALIVSAAKERSIEQANYIRKIIMEWDFLSELKPRGEQRNSVLAFDVGPAGTMQQPSIKCAGITGQITGSRADLILADDVEIPSNALTQLKRDRLDTLVREFDAVLKPGGEVKYLGTPQIEDSLYRRLERRGETEPGVPLYSTMILPARYPDEARRAQYGDRLAERISMDLDSGAAVVNAPTDPKRFGEQDLIERAISYGKAGFALQFMLDTSLSDAERYPLKLVDFIVHDVDLDVAPLKLVWASTPEYTCNDLPADCLSGDRWQRAAFIDKDVAPYHSTVMFIDPAGRGKDRVGFAVTKGLHGYVYIPPGGWGSLTGGYDEPTLIKLACIARDLKVKLCLIEPNMGDGMFLQLAIPVFRKYAPGCGLEEAEWASAQKERRIADTLEPVLGRHRLVIDPAVIRADYEAHKTEQDRQHGAIFQTTRLTRDRGALLHDDALDALAGAVAWWNSALAVDVEAMASDARADALDKELEKFCNDIERGAAGETGEPETTPSWV